MSDPKDSLICVAGKSRGGVRAFDLNQYPENPNSVIFLALIQTGNQKKQIDPRTGPTFGAIGSSARDQNRASELLEAEPLACPPKRGLSAVPRITFRANADARRLKAARVRLAVAAQQQRQGGGVFVR